MKKTIKASKLVVLSQTGMFPAGKHGRFYKQLGPQTAIKFWAIFKRAVEGV